MKFLFGAIVGLGSLGLVTAAQAANPQHVERLLKTNQCPLCDLRGADLAEANLYGANLVGADLRGANLRGANLGSVNLSDADLSQAQLNRAYLYQVTLEAANFQGADLSGAYLKGVDLNQVNLANAKFVKANLSRTNLVASDLSGVNFANANLSGALLTGLTFPENVGQLNQVPGQIRTSLCERDTKPTDQELAGAKEAGFELSVAQLAGVNFQGANLRSALLFAGNLQGADLRDANLTNACLNVADLTGAKLDRANLKGTRLQATLLERASLKNLKNADLSEAYKTTADAKRVPIEAQTKRVTAAITAAQQAFHREKLKFAESIQELGIPTTSFTEEYDYKVIPSDAKQEQVMIIAQPKLAGYHAFIGVLAVVVDQETQAARARGILCSSEKPTQLIPAFPRLNAGQLPTCPAGYKSGS